MHKLKKLILLILSISIASLYLMFSNSTEIEASSNDNNSINYLKLINKSTSLSTIYSEKYQTRIHNQINKQKKLNNYTFQHPLLIRNPYGTNTTAVYMYFKTTEELQAGYTIHCNNYADFSQTLNSNTLSGYTTEHEYLLIGAIPNQTNTITVTLTNKQGKVVDTLSWSYNALHYKAVINILQ